MGATTTFLLLYCAALATLPRTLPAQTGFAEIYAFGHQPDAHAPGGLVLGPDGALYGVGASGGTYGYGAVFRLQPPSSSGGAWTETVLHSFTGQNGDGIVGGYLTTPVFGPNGALYGTTSGTVFELRPPATPGGRWIENILYSFPGPGVYPRSMLVGSGGTLYSTAFSGGLTAKAWFSPCRPHAWQVAHGRNMPSTTSLAPLTEHSPIPHRRAQRSLVRHHRPWWRLQ